MGREDWGGEKDLGRMAGLKGGISNSTGFTTFGRTSGLDEELSKCGSHYELPRYLPT